MSDFHIRMDPDLDNKVATLPTVLDTAMGVAEKIASAARADAPVDTGDYRDSIVAEKTKRGARVHASDPKAAWIEFGAPAANIPARFNLRGAAQRLGFKFRKGRGNA